MDGAKLITLLKMNVLTLFPSKAGEIVITGDLPMNQGSIWLVPNGMAQAGQIEKKIELSGYTHLAAKNGDDILLVYREGVSIVDSGYKERRIANLPLLDIYPNSIARVGSSDIYIGMKAFVVRLTQQLLTGVANRTPMPAFSLVPNYLASFGAEQLITDN